MTDRNRFGIPLNSVKSKTHPADQAASTPGRAASEKQAPPTLNDATGADSKTSPQECPCCGHAKDGSKCTGNGQTDQPPANPPLAEPPGRQINRPQHLYAYVPCAMTSHPPGANGLHLHPDLDGDPEGYFASVAEHIEGTAINAVLVHLPGGLMRDGNQRFDSIGTANAHWAMRLQRGLRGLTRKYRVIVYLGPQERPQDSMRFSDWSTLAFFESCCHGIIVDGRGDDPAILLESSNPASHLLIGPEPWPRYEDGTHYDIMCATTQLLGNPHTLSRSAHIDNRLHQISQRAPLGYFMGELIIIDNGWRNPDGTNTQTTSDEEVVANTKQLWNLGLSPCIPFYMAQSTRFERVTNLIHLEQ